VGAGGFDGPTVLQGGGAMILQRQPSKTSCGPAVVAMLAGVPVSVVLGRLAQARQGKRQGKRTHSTNVAELMRLLGAWGFVLGRRLRGSVPERGRFVLRIQTPGRRGWHWAALVDGEVFDPARFDVGVVGDYDPRSLSFYEVEGRL
jgi:hypothetical protein